MFAIKHYPLDFALMKKKSSPFGDRIHPITKVKTLHTGIDYAAPMGSKIYAIADGRVVVSKKQGNGKGLGEYIVIEHDDGFYSLYAHLYVRLVKAGPVKAGELIGYSGNTGDSTGPHLHFGICRHYNPVNVSSSLWQDPQPYLEEADVLNVETLTVLKDGKKVKVERVLIDGTNFVRLRDFDDKLQLCKVDYDAQKGMPIINTK